MYVSRTLAAVLLVGTLALGGCLTSLKLGINTAYTDLTATAAKIDANVPLVEADLQPASQVVIMVNNFAQSAVALGVIPQGGKSQASVNRDRALAALNAFANSSSTVQAANGQLPNNPAVLASGILATVAQVKAATQNKVTAAAAVATNGSAAGATAGAAIGVAAGVTSSGPTVSVTAGAN